MKTLRSQPIGIFDSGIGGLTVMREIMERLPHENIIYYGDTVRLPYGNKSKEVITRYSIENAIFLMEQNIKLLVIACHTASAFALERLQRIFSIPILGVIEPGAEEAIKTSKKKCIAVLGTKGTITSGIYQREIEKKLPNAKVISIACPLFVPLVEEGFFNHPATEMIIKEYLAPLKDHHVDTVLLGCTHYPLLKQRILDELSQEVIVVDSAFTCAEKVAQLLQIGQLENDLKTHPDYQYFVSDDPIKFQSLGVDFFKIPMKNVILNRVI